jgi:hypothetical protein
MQLEYANSITTKSKTTSSTRYTTAMLSTTIVDGNPTAYISELAGLVILIVTSVSFNSVTMESRLL